MCDCYRAAPGRSRDGVHTVCVDEMTGVQARERIAPTKPMRPGQTEKVEFEYKRHGTQCLIGNFEVATGEVIAPTVKRRGGRRTSPTTSSGRWRRTRTRGGSSWRTT